MKGGPRDFEIVLCPGCDQRRSAYVPKGGDGSAVKIVRHNRPRPGALAGYTGRERCPGSDSIGAMRLGRWVDL